MEQRIHAHQPLARERDPVGGQLCEIAADCSDASCGLNRTSGSGRIVPRSTADARPRA